MDIYITLVMFESVNFKKLECSQVQLKTRKYTEDKANFKKNRYTFMLQIVSNINLKIELMN